MPVPKNPAQPAVAPKPKMTPRKVRATRLGYYDHARRREGDVFLVEADEFSDLWMEDAPPDTPVVTTGPQAALNEQLSQELAGRRPVRRSGTDKDVLS